jgi:hypothetical protein
LLHDAAYRSTSALGGANENADASRLSESLRGFRYAKFGLAGCAAHAHWVDRWQAALARLPRGIGPVAVAYADWRGADAPPPAEVLRVGASLGCCGLLLDTCHKAAGDLFRCLSHGEAAALVAVAHRAGMFVAVGGSLSLETTAQALETGADIIAVRGAVCRGGRDADVDVKLVRSLAAHVKRSTAAIPHGAQLDA